MKTQMNILRISAGRIDSNDTLYANAIMVDENISDEISQDRIDVGQKHAKVKIDTSNNNELAIRFAKSGLVPGVVEVEIVTSVKGGEASFTIVNFTDKKLAA